MVLRQANLNNEEELRQKVSSDPEYQKVFLQEKGKLLFRYFCREILGFRDMNKDHDALCDFLQYDEAEIKLVLMPRFTFKSWICTIAHTLWLLMRDPSERMLIYSDSTEKSEGFLSGIKSHILGQAENSLFRAVYGPMEIPAKPGPWNLSEINIRVREGGAIAASIETAGIETAKVGKHYTRIKFDDLVSDKNVTTKELMDKVDNVYRNSGGLRYRSGKTDLVGTRWHFGDLYGRLLSELKGDKRFSVFHRKAHDEGVFFFDNIGKESLTQERCENLKKDWGSYKYACLIQNEPVDDETATFKTKDFSFYDEVPEGLYITCCLDPIPPHEGTKGDDAALTVCGTDHELNLYILDIVSGRLQPSEQIEELFRLHRKWQINAFGVETNSFQKVMRRDIEFRYKEERLNNPSFRFFSIQEFVGASLPNKELRIRGLQPYHERGALRFPGKSLDTLKGVYYDLAFQLIQFPKSAKDDLSDSLSFHTQIHRKGTKRDFKEEIPWGSAKWYEKEIWYKKQVRQVQEAPRWNRPPMPELSFN